MIQSKLLSFSGLLLIAILLLTASCSNEETYREQKEKERDAITAFIGRDVTINDNEGLPLFHVGRINDNLISEERFREQGYTTDTARNEYVYFGSTGVYMQVVRKGSGDKLQNGQTKHVLVRYVEFNILRDSIQSRNTSLYYHTTPDVIDITNTYGTFTASFSTLDGGGAMYRIYGSTEVPAGWLVPFSYINLARQDARDHEIAKVRLIVPHSQGHADARNGVYPCFYEMTFQETRY